MICGTGKTMATRLVWPTPAWATSPAISFPRTDPITGEILNASITLDANVIRDLQVEHQRNLASLGTSRQRALDVLRRDSARKETDDFYLFATPEERAREALEDHLRS